ncbi:uncharacterized protein LOC119725487 [Patiria miniata]|uniref:Reverse transcriptase domain-containing protein n=1 Tax=Patiria miniata TaxID=46514 RepID=A0A913ZP54_PATMI|nr:uncharacterized protein LOC119725487 [Patiria miniata]
MNKAAVAQNLRIISSEFFIDSSHFMVAAVVKKAREHPSLSTKQTEEQLIPNQLWELFEKQLHIKVNFRIHRLELMRYRQKPDESLDNFVNRCRAKAHECNFGPEEMTERIIKLVIASTTSESFQKDLLDKPIGFSIDDMLQEGRKYEAILAGKKCLETLEASHTAVHAFRPTGRTCGNCGLSHPPRRCPAYRDTCKSCGSKGHWAKFCRKTRSQGKRKGKSPSRRGRSPSRGNTTRRPRSKSRSNAGKQKPSDTNRDEQPIHSAEASEEYETVFHTVTVSNLCMSSIDNNREAYTTLDVICPDLIGTHRLITKVDTGAGGNTLPLRTIKQMYGCRWKSFVQPVKTKLTAYNGTEIVCLGCIELLCRYKTPKWTKNRFYVVDVPGPAIAGLPMCCELEVVTIHSTESSPQPPASPKQPGVGEPQNLSHDTIKSVHDLVRLYPNQFDTIGNFKARATLHLKEDAKPSIDAPRKCSIHLKPKLKIEIDKMEQQGVIRKVTHHTDWCSSITTNLKQDGTLRVCLDPKRLNQSLKRCPHKIPTLEELNPAFSQAKFFSKLDAKAGYWAVKLEEESQELTTFRTPFGRYCFQRLPFGLSISQDIFQQCMDDIIEQVPGCVGIADDVAVYGRTEEEHDANLLNLLQIASREGLVFNSNKCHIKTNQINFFGSLYSDTGIRPDPGRIEDIHSIPTPQDKEDLQKFLGLITYVSAYIPNLADKAATLRDLLKKNVPYLWQDDHQAAFEALKYSITTEACLQYYNPEIHTVLEVDASQKGLGACLLQNNRPIAFASKSLSPAQANYSNIERETLTLVFGITRFHSYLFGKEFTLHTDHKPLEMIWKKPLSSAPPRLQAC